MRAWPRTEGGRGKQAYRATARPPPTARHRRVRIGIMARGQRPAACRSERADCRPSPPRHRRRRKWAAGAVRGRAPSAAAPRWLARAHPGHHLPGVCAPPSAMQHLPGYARRSIRKRTASAISCTVDTPCRGESVLRESLRVILVRQRVDAPGATVLARIKLHPRIFHA